jgi:hypothetical protein
MREAAGAPDPVRAVRHSRWTRCQQARPNCAAAEVMQVIYEKVRVNARRPHDPNQDW